MAESRMLGDYQLGACIGKGGFGSVFQAVNVTNADFVAIKQTNISKIPKDELAGIMTEIDLLKKLNHENIVKYVGYTKTKDFLYIILEYVENGSLLGIVQKFGKFPESLVRVFMRQTLEGLKYLHDQGVIHRDIKGANILSTKQGTVKLADFGVATMIGKVEKKGGGGPDDLDADVAGTPYWMAPEIIELSGATPKSDIWSVGCTVVELITGEPPYFDLAPMPALFRIVKDDHPPLPEGISAQLQDFLMQCFKKEPALRSSAEKLLKHRWLKDVNAVPKSIAPSAPTSAPAVSNASKLMPNFEENVKEYNEKLNANISADDNKRQSILLQTISGLSNLINKEKEDGGGKRGGKKTKEKKDRKEKKALKDKKRREKKERKTKTKDKAASTSGLAKNPSKPGASSFAETGDDDDDWDSMLDDIDDLAIGDKKVNTGSTGPAPASPFSGMDDDEDDEDDDWGDIDIAELENIGAPRGGMRLIHPSEMGTMGLASPLVEATTKLNKWGETDDDDWDDLGGKDEFDFDAPAESTEPELEGDDLFAQMQKKLSAQQNETEMANEADWGEDDDDPFDLDVDDEDEDPFGDEGRALRDNYHKISIELLKALTHLKTNPPDAQERCAEMMSILRSYRDVKVRFIRHYGVIPVIEVLEAASDDLLATVLRLVNQIIDGSGEIQENLCMVGGIPTIMEYTARTYPLDVRLEAARFIKHMCSTSPFTLQMYIACRGLPALVTLLETSAYDVEKEIVWMAVEGIASVFKLHSSTPKNDFCRLFVKCGALSALVKTLDATVHDKDGLSHAEEVVDILQLFSHGDATVKNYFADEAEGGVLQNLWRIFTVLQDDMERNCNLITGTLKAIKQLSSDASTLVPLQKSNAIPQLVPLFEKSGDFPDMGNQLLMCLYNLTRISKERQEQAADAGIVPHLKYFIDQNSALRAVAIPMLCDLGHVHAARKHLWDNSGVVYFLSLLQDKYWRVNALESLAVWLNDETIKVGRLLSQKRSHIKMLKEAFVTTHGQQFMNLVNPFLRIVTQSPTVAEGLARNEDLVQKLLERLRNPRQDGSVRVDLMKMLQALYEAHKAPRSLLKKVPILSALEELCGDKSVLIQELASQMKSTIEERKRR